MRPTNLEAIRAASEFDPAHNRDDAEYVLGHPDDYGPEEYAEAQALVDRIEAQA